MALNLQQAALIKRKKAGKPELTEKQKTLLDAGSGLGGGQRGQSRKGAPASIAVKDISPRAEIKRRRDKQDDIG